jgi:hypothetical protein
MTRNAWTTQEDEMSEIEVAVKQVRAALEIEEGHRAIFGNRGIPTLEAYARVAVATMAQLQKEKLA